MTRKDAAGFQTPVDQYRKQIGKQDWKKSKKDIKAQKRAADQQSQLGITGMLLTVTALLVLLGGVYGFLYWYLSIPSADEAGEEKVA